MYFNLFKKQILVFFKYTQFKRQEFRMAFQGKKFYLCRPIGEVHDRLVGCHPEACRRIYKYSVRSFTSRSG